MKPLLLVAWLCLLPSVLMAQYGVERTSKLGFGFREVTVAEPSASAFESIAHRSYLYYGDEKLCAMSAYSLAPNGKFAVYLDGDTGVLRLFRRADEKRYRLDARGTVRSFEWLLPDGKVLVHLEGSKTPKVYLLP